MGKGSRTRTERSASPVRETHEPETPRNWPHGHVGVALTAEDQDECVEVTVHGVKHYLHSTTARELSNMLLEKIEEWNLTASSNGFEPV